MNINYADTIPNNVDLGGDKVLQRALEHWQPEFRKWWADMGPEGSHSADVYLRTAVSVHPSGWAHYEYVKMPEYRWGIFLSPTDGNLRLVGHPQYIPDFRSGTGTVERHAELHSTCRG